MGCLKLENSGILKGMKKTTIKLLLLFLGLTLGMASTAGWAQADTYSLVPAQFSLEGDSENRLLDADPRFGPKVIFDLFNEGNQAALIELLSESPSPYAVTRALIISYLTEESIGFLRSYAFEQGQPDENLSDAELTALMNSPLAESDIQRLASWMRLLNEPGLIGAGSEADAFAISRLFLRNEIRSLDIPFRGGQIELLKQIQFITDITGDRLEFLLDVWMVLQNSPQLTSDAKDGISQLISMVAMADTVSTQVKKDLILEQFGIPVGNGFLNAQYGVIYIVLKSVPDHLRGNLRQVVTLQTLRPGNDPTSNVAGLYTARRIAVRVSLNLEAFTGTFQHEIGHLAWDTVLTFQQRNQYSQLYNQSQEGTIDFVSDYAMTNALEDYAEVFQAYMDDSIGWTERTERSSILRQKLALVASPLMPFVYETISNSGTIRIQRATVVFQSGLPNLSTPLGWERI